MLITDIYLRILFGFYSVAIGLVFLKVYSDRDKDSLWGNVFRAGTVKRLHKEKIYLVIGWFSIIAGLIVLLFGFCLNMTGGC